MNEKALKILEYNKIIDRLTEYASSSMGKELCKKLLPSANLADIEQNQAETGDALSRLYKHGSLSFSGLIDITPSLKRLMVGASLGAGELLGIAKLLSIAQTAKQYSHTSENMEDNDSLTFLFEDLAPLTPLMMEIKRCILAEDEISDDASPTLRDIRRQIKQTNIRLHNQLTSIVSSQSNKSMLQDSIITMRNGRYCIPVKQEHRSNFSGMIHDQSQTGATLFIEPMAIVNLNNELKELAGKEQTEIEKILAGLSEQVHFEQEEIANNLQILTKLDFIFAKAKLAKSYNGTEPVFNEEGKVNIKQGRHPLLSSQSVVPINLYLGTDFTMLVVTGPNTGGKTVSLKTIGLFTLMGQAGLHIPALSKSELSTFDDVYADIGDEQSIEQNLSTFSSHMTNIVSILNQATNHSLVLLDELCGGTDPMEGAALAIAILSNLHGRQITTMATTHYSELKAFALATAGVENACCEFDLATLSPTYRLMIGLPGKSNAFAISQKLGLDPYVIEDARSQIDASARDFEAMLEELESTKLQIEKEREDIYEKTAEVEKLRQSLKEKEEQVRQKKNEILTNARQQARDILTEAKETADEAIRKYNNWGKHTQQNNTKKMEAERSKLRGKMGELEKQLAYKSKRNKRNQHRPEDFHIGDNVFVTTLNLNGVISTLPNPKGDLYVQMGMLRSLVNYKNLELLESEKPKQQVQGGYSKPNMIKSATISPEINLLGKTVDEAINELDKYLDDAYLSKLSQVTIIHGKGTGALRSAIHNYLRKQKHIKTFRSGVYGEGEAGVTIVEF